jgi:hypothetical protein
MTGAQETSLGGGRYRLDRPIGRGGRSVVWRAWDYQLGLWRAVKVLDDRHVYLAEQREHFEADARQVAMLEHRNIVRVVDVGRERGVPFVVMDLVEGGSLSRRIQRHGPLPPLLAVAALVEVCNGLAHAHAYGLLHREVKPQNVLVGPDQVPRLTDFGGMRMEGLSPSFLAPEQRAGRRVDQRADVYGAGALLYVLVTGERPDELHALPQSAAPDFQTLPPPLQSLIIAATSPEPSRRPQSIEELAQALRGVRSSLPAIPTDTQHLHVPMAELPVIAVAGLLLPSGTTVAPSPPRPPAPRARTQMSPMMTAIMGAVMTLAGLLMVLAMVLGVVAAYLVREAQLEEAQAGRPPAPAPAVIPAPAPLPVAAPAPVPEPVPVVEPAPVPEPVVVPEPVPEPAPAPVPAPVVVAPAPVVVPVPTPAPAPAPAPLPAPVAVVPAPAPTPAPSDLRSPEDAPRSSQLELPKR